jgi:hypothetical protein
VIAVDRDKERVEVDSSGGHFVAHTHRDGDLIVATTLSTPGSGRGQA